MPTPSTILDRLYDGLHDDLSRIVGRFTVPMKVTLIVRDPNNPEREVVIGDDTFDGAIEALERRRGTKPSHGPEAD